jgi:hypothetical protein
MVTAVGCYYAAREHAFTSRIQALAAAKRGDRTEAIRLTADAQHHDRIAEDWMKIVPDWQWKAWNEEDEGGT